MFVASLPYSFPTLLGLKLSLWPIRISMSTVFGEVQVLCARGSGPAPFCIPNPPTTLPLTVHPPGLPKEAGGLNPSSTCACVTWVKSPFTSLHLTLHLHQIKVIIPFCQGCRKDGTRQGKSPTASPKPSSPEPPWGSSNPGHSPLHSCSFAPAAPESAFNTHHSALCNAIISRGHRLRCHGNRSPSTNSI